jgi:hypothetical protein
VRLSACAGSVQVKRPLFERAVDYRRDHISPGGGNCH